jgi:hypothetical protein
MIKKNYYLLNILLEMLLIQGYFIKEKKKIYLQKLIGDK